MSMIDETTQSSDRDRAGRRSATPLVVGMVIILLAVVVYFATGMPGMDHSGSGMDHDMSSNAAHRMVGLAEFEEVVANTETVTINVNVPAAETQIDGTDLTMPYDAINPDGLPSNRDVALAVYCRTGAMSAVAVQRLFNLGYTNVVELDGGTDASVGN